jgi:L-ascorbate metabolism protein UlaG (beta-lactamase superfamily)
MPEETVQAHIDLNGKLLMPIHWGAFKLALHDWEEPVERLLKKADALHVKVTTPRIGEQVILNNHFPNNHFPNNHFPNSKWWKKHLKI